MFTDCSGFFGPPLSVLNLKEGIFGLPGKPCFTAVNEVKGGGV